MDIFYYPNISFIFVSICFWMTSDLLSSCLIHFKNSLLLQRCLVIIVVEMLLKIYLGGS